MAIDYCINKKGFDAEHFKCIDVLDNQNNNILRKWFGCFDFIIAADVLYYFTENEIRKITSICYEMLKDGGFFYATMFPFNEDKYIKICNDNEGESFTKKSKSINTGFKYCFIDDPNKIEDIFSIFDKDKILISCNEYYSFTAKTFHYIGRKNIKVKAE